MRDESPIPLIFKAISVITLAMLAIPVVIVVLAGLNAGDYLTFPPQGLSLRWVISFLTSPTFLSAYGISFLVAAISTVISTVIGAMAALFLTRAGGRVVAVLRAFFMMPIVLPGVVLGLALYVFYVSSGIGLARSLAGLVIGHVIVTCPFVIATVTAALVGFDRSLEEAARSLGASPFAAFRLVTLKIISPAISAGTIFAFIISFGQFEVTLFLSTPNLQTLPMAMYVALRYSFEPTAAAAGIFAIVLVVISMVATSRLVNLKRIFGG
ncbi:ABC transporter permease [Xaviernesmea oryzae]|uniref:Putative spermidine/putrescine transport system permease protein n=1 Tax=Xaviernesmea oryzae TaxID=464029 RepID=A0A1X7FX52_9HYPH|nr:ABC transporter permease [Xaviernesmea oryzae]SMF59695.1 putative spermidine/putrescine transport system permease protein [Xaviernesmea oryzae]